MCPVNQPRRAGRIVVRIVSRVVLADIVRTVSREVLADIMVVRTVSREMLVSQGMRDMV